MIERASVWWCVICLGIGALAGGFAFCDAQKFAAIVDLLATIISVLIGVSLAVIAVLNSPFKVSGKRIADPDEAKRIENLLKYDDQYIAAGQSIMFYIFYTALFCSLVFKWLTIGEAANFNALFIKVCAFITAFISFFAFMWSARLPNLINMISQQRRTFE